MTCIINFVASLLFMLNISIFLLSNVYSDVFHPPFRYINVTKHRKTFKLVKVQDGQDALVVT